MTAQTKAQSAIESATSTAVGYAAAVASQLVVFPVCGIHATYRQTFTVAAYFTAVSLVRQYSVRRWFNRFQEDSPPVEVSVHREEVQRAIDGGAGR